MITLAGYQNLIQIHDGKNSVVYRAQRVEDEKAVVLKFLKADYPTTEQLRRYRQEYYLASQLDLPNVIKAYSLEAWQRTLVIAFEDFGAISLQHWLAQRSEKLSVTLCLSLALKITKALEQLHSQGVIHKDINPSNIVLNPETMAIKLIDLGISTQLSRENAPMQPLCALEGTLPYLSPEQTGRMNRALDYRSDFYSLGATLYELLTDRPPFAGDDLVELVHSHIARQPLPPQEATPGVPPQVSAIVMRLLEKNAEARYQSAWGLQLDLQRCLKSWQTHGSIDAFDLGQQDLSDRFQIPQKLYGREAEVQTLLTAFDRIASGGGEDAQPATASWVLVSGYSGIGKSALVQEIYKPITAQRGYYLSGKYDQFQRNLPYSALLQAFTILVRQLLTGSDAEIMHWRDRLVAALAPNAAVLIDVIPEIELIIGPQPTVPTLAGDAAQNRFNLVFENFIRVFSQPQHPLVLFLDDLQWADSASLQLIQVLLSASRQQSLLLIGAYRDNEVDASHPLRATLSALQSAQVPVQELHLQPLSHIHIQHLLGDAFPGVAAAAISDLATLLQRKTNGNPFFMSEFLKSLYSDGWITFEPGQGWQWDLHQIQAAQITDNVVELMAGKLQKLPADTQSALQVGACIGSYFALNLLARVQGIRPVVMAQTLWEAAKLGLIVPQDDNYKLLQVEEVPLTQPEVDVIYRFPHDRVQQAAYSLIPDREKAALHLQVGQTLQQVLAAERQQEYLFDIVNQLNFGVELLPTAQQRQALAELNLAAGQKAIAAAAYDPAYTYLSIGIRCLAQASWQQQYELTLALHQNAAEAAFLKGDFETMDRLIATMVSQARSVLDCVPIYTVQIQSLVARHELAAASQQGLRVLQQLQVRLPSQPGQLQILLGLMRAKLALSGKSIAQLAAQPEMQDPVAVAATQVLASIASATYLAAPNLFPLTVFKQVELSARYGNVPLSAFSYATYGLILCGVVGDLAGGYGFGELALQVLARFEARALRARTLFVVNAFVRHWRDPLPETVSPLLQGFQAGYETGDTEYAGFCAQVSIMHGYFHGEPLPELEERAHILGEAILKFKKQPIYELVQQSQQAIANLCRPSETPTRLVGTFYNADAMLPRHVASDYRTAVFYTHTYTLQLSYLFGDYAIAVAAADQGRSYLDAVIALFISGWFHFYDALARLALAETAAPAQRRQLLRTVAKTRRRLQTWATSAPANYRHKLTLVEAEQHRLRGEWEAAGRAYDRAIEQANEQRFFPEAALANERAALFYLAQNRPRLAIAYFQEARFLYDQWGAAAKVAHLDACFPQFAQFDAAHVPTKPHSATGNATEHSTTGNQTSSDLDLVTVIKAAQTLSEEIQLDKLLTTLMRLLIENAGAQRGFLLLETNGHFRIEAQGAVDQAEVSVTKSIIPENTQVLSVGIVNYVARTQTSVVLNDATAAEDFAQDAYIQQQRPRAILCAPLLNQGKLAGIVYLENNLTPGAFTPQRLELLNLISTQAAISIENARLYTQVRNSEQQLKQFLEAVPVGIGVIDRSGHPYYINQRAREILGQGTVKEAVASDIAEMYQTYVAGTEDLYPNEHLPIVRALRGETTSVDDIEIHQGDRVIPIESRGTPIYAESGDVQYAITIFQDITERKRAEKILADYSQELEQAVGRRTAELAQEIRERRRAEAELQHANQELQRLANMDGLTHVANRRYFDQQLQQEWQRLRREQHPLALILFDVDYFKRYRAPRFIGFFIGSETHLRLRYYSKPQDSPAEVLTAGQTTQ